MRGSSRIAMLAMAMMSVATRTGALSPDDRKPSAKNRVYRGSAVNWAYRKHRNSRISDRRKARGHVRVRAMRRRKAGKS